MLCKKIRNPEKVKDRWKNWQLPRGTQTNT